MSVDRVAEAPGRDIWSLIEDLRAAGFNVGTSEAVDATRLLLLLARNEKKPMTPSRLCARLRPIFCKNREQQDAFDAVFVPWYGSGESESPVPLLRGPVVLPPVVKQKAARKIVWQVWTAITLALLFGAIAFILRPPARIGPIATVTSTTTTSSSVTTSTSTSPVTPLAPLAQKTDISGYFPRLRYNDELRPRWGWAVAAMPLVALLGFSLPAVMIARHRARRRNDPVYLDRQTLEQDARRIVPMLRPEIAFRLSRHIRMSPENDARLPRRPVLDVRATVEHTMRNRGIPTPRYRSTHATPSYLLLVDVANQKDPRGRLFYLWAERLQRQRLEVEIALVRLHDGEPQFAPITHGELSADERSWKSLARLPNPPFGQRLMVVSSGELLVDDQVSWRSEAVAARLHRWRQRVLFTPHEPRDWGPREDEIERKEHTADPGFLVLPLDENALSAWTELLTSGQLKDIVLSEPQRFPGELRRGKGADLVKDDVPDPKRIEKLIGQLRVYLGDLGFSWLAALSIPPIVRWELTVLIGRDLIQRLTSLKSEDVDAALARNYRRLVRLPWLREETMPDWLRLRLLAELAPEVQQKIRESVEAQLGKLKPAAKGQGIPLDFEQPPRRGGTTPSRAMDQDSDPIYLGYMSGLTPRQLAMRVPQAWGKWLGKMRFPRERGVRGFLSTSAEYARSWWSRRVFLGGLSLSGLRRAPFVWAGALILLGAALLTMVARKDRDWWPEALQPLLFEEQAHAIAFHHDGPILAAEFSRDGRLIVTAGADGIARVWDVKSGAPVCPPLRHDGPVKDARFSDGDQRVVTASGEAAIVWNIDTGLRLGEEISHGVPIEHVEVAADDDRVLTSGSGRVRAWRRGTSVATYELYELIGFESADRARFGRGRGDVLLSGRGGWKAWYPAGNGPPLASFDTAPVADASVSVDRMVLTYSRNTAWLWDYGRSRMLAWMDHPAPVVHAEFNRSGARVVTASDGKARVWDVPANRLVQVLSHRAKLISATFSRDGESILTVSADGTARVWNAKSGSQLGPELRHGAAISSAAFSADGARIITAGSDGIARVWEAINDQPETPPLRHKGVVSVASFDADGQRALTASWDGSAKIWDARNGVQLVTLRHEGEIWEAMWSPDGRTVITGGSDGRAVIWSSQSGKPVGQPLVHGEEVYSAAFSTDGRKIVTASGLSAVLWEARTGRQAHRFVHGRTVLIARFSPDDRYVATAAFDVGRVWDSKASGAPILLDSPEGTVWDVAFSPDGRLVVTAADEATIWDARTGRLRITVKHDVRVAAAEFDAQSQRLLTAGGDGIARISDVASGTPLREFRHVGALFQASFSPDGRLVVTASQDGTARLWDARTAQLVAPPFRHRGVVTLVKFSPDGKRLISASEDAADAWMRQPVLPNDYVVPLDSAQIWTVPPLHTPPVSPAGALRRGFDATLARYYIGKSALLVAAALAGVTFAILLIVGLRARKQLERLVVSLPREDVA